MYCKIIDFDDITLEDCLRFFDYGKTFIIECGKIVNIIKEN